MRFLLFLLALPMVFSASGEPRSALDINYYGYMTCDGKSCVGKECGVDLFVYYNGGFQEDKGSKLCDLRKYYTDGRFHIQCYASRFLGRPCSFYLKFFGRCGEGNAWSQRLMELPITTKPIEYMGEVNVPKVPVKENINAN